MTQVLVIAPHPDDETLGCGGTLLRHVLEGDAVHWLIMTGMPEGGPYSRETIAQRQQEIQAAGEAYGFTGIHRLDLPTCELDRIGKGDLIGHVGEIFKQVNPETVYLPFPGDAHSDHRASFEAALACCKWFRYPSVKRVLAYETLSETQFGIDPTTAPFQPNVFVDIGPFLERKLEIMRIFASELGRFPFPRSVEALRAQATLHGSTAGRKAAEAFMLIKEVR